MIVQIPSERHVRLIDSDDIIAVMADDKAVTVVYEQGQAVRNIRTWAYTVREFAKQVGMLPVSRSAAVNKSKIVKITPAAYRANCIDLHFRSDGLKPVRVSRRLTPSVRRVLRTQSGITHLTKCRMA